MIDFRYHIVSLVAVFLAIALGIVIGTTALNGRVLDDLRGEVTGLQDDKRNLEDRTRGLEDRLDVGDDFEEAVGPALVRDTLADRSVVLVAVGDEVGDDTVDQVNGLVEDAGGAVTGTIRLASEYSDPANDGELRNYVTGPGMPAGITLPDTDDTGQLVAAVLAQVLIVPPGDAPAADPAALNTVLAGLSSLGVLSKETSVAPADYAVVLTSGEVDGDDVDDRLTTLTELLSALDAAGSGAVVSGDAAAARAAGLVGAVRADPELSAGISTVDNLDTAAGRISTVLALAQEGLGVSGLYGTEEGTDAAPPVPVGAS